MCRTCLLCVLLGLAIARPSLADMIDGEELADPTRPLLQMQAPERVQEGGGVESRLLPARYEVTFVRAGSTTPMAVVNDQRVTLGDVIGQATVIAIDRSGVTLRVNNQEQRVSLFTTNVKRAPAAANQAGAVDR